MKTKHETQVTAFTADYAQKAHLQTTFNENIINKLTEKIFGLYEKHFKEPLNILDLCCGHGKPTYDLFINLRNKG